MVLIVGVAEPIEAQWSADGANAKLRIYRTRAGLIEYLQSDGSTWSTTTYEFSMTLTAGVWSYSFTPPSDSDGYVIFFEATNSGYPPMMYEDYVDTGVPPGPHTHVISDVTNLQTTLDAKALASDLTNHASATTGVHGVGASTVESTSGAQAKADAVQTNLNTHASATTGIHGVTGSVVGTSDTQTLTNKTLGAGSKLGATLDGNGQYLDMKWGALQRTIVDSRYIGAGGNQIFGSHNLLYLAPERYTVTWSNLTGVTSPDNLWRSDDSHVGIDLATAVYPLTVTVSGTFPSTTGVSQIRPFFVAHGTHFWNLVKLELLLNDGITWVEIDQDTTRKPYFMGKSTGDAGYSTQTTHWPYKGFRITLDQPTATTGMGYLGHAGLFAPRHEAWPEYLLKMGGALYENVTVKAGKTIDGVDISDHANATTSIHGITDTSVLETVSGSQAKVDAHAADTTAVHGITDTSALETTSGAQAKVDAHAGTALASAHTTGSLPESRVTFDATNGHAHDGTDSKNVTDTNINWTTSADASASPVTTSHRHVSGTDVNNELFIDQYDRTASEGFRNFDGTTGYVRGTNFKVKGRKASGIDITITYNGLTYNEASVEVTFPTVTTWEFNGPAGTEATRTFTVSQTGQINQSVSIVVDRTVPSVSLAWNATNGGASGTPMYRGEYGRWTPTYSDGGSGVASATYSYSNAGHWTGEPTTAGASGATTSFIRSSSSAPITVTTSDITLTVTDKAGNVGTATVSAHFAALPAAPTVGTPSISSTNQRPTHLVASDTITGTFSLSGVAACRNSGVDDTYGGFTDGSLLITESNVVDLAGDVSVTDTVSVPSQTERTASNIRAVVVDQHYRPTYTGYVGDFAFNPNRSTDTGTDPNMGPAALPYTGHAYHNLTDENNVVSVSSATIIGGRIRWDAATGEAVLDIAVSGNVSNEYELRLGDSAGSELTWGAQSANLAVEVWNGTAYVGPDTSNSFGSGSKFTAGTSGATTLRVKVKRLTASGPDVGVVAVNYKL